MLIQKRKRKHQNRHIEKTLITVKKPLKKTIMSTEKKDVVGKEMNMFCVHLMKAL